ncbi:class F sortase, partial [Microbacterium sp. ARD31]|uniref:class F sortase n=1 Tax=Microbacterium sp. ARD31 TaxID=2962576 RepID=UPI002880CCDB
PHAAGPRPAARSGTAPAAAVPAGHDTRSPRTAPARGAGRGPARPVAVVVPALGVGAALDPIGLQDGSLTPPADPTRVGWWGARPGSLHGTAVLTGHTVHTGGGAFDELEDLGVGDEVSLRTAGRTLDYEVRSVRVLTRAQLARRSSALFDQSGRARLVLVTCEDWDGQAYRSNVVVTAVPLD